ncbi:MAG: AMP-binding protein, partial [Mangrovicoccus sp.]
MQSIIDLSPPPPCPEPFNLTAHVLAKAENDPDKIALAILGLSGAERWSYGKLNRTVLGLAGALAEMNLPSGARILMRLGNSVEFPLAFLAAIAAGYVPIPTSSQLTTREINKISEEVQPSLIFAGEGIALPDPLPCPSLSEA